MKSTKWIKIFFGLSLIGVLFVGGVNYIVDPLWMFDYSNKFNQKQDGFDERQQKTNYIYFKSQGNFDGILLGSSRATFVNQNDFIDMNIFNYSSNSMQPFEYKGYIARMKFFIGARTHATIAAYSSGVPTMVLGYSVKSKGIAKDIFDEEKLVLGIDEISDAKKLIAKFEEMKTEEDSIKEILKNRIPEIKAMSQKAKFYLAELI